MLTPLIQRHVLRGTVKARQLETRVYRTTGQGQEVSIRVRGNTIRINNAAVIDPDIKASNGVIHVVDAVIMLRVADGRE